MIEREYNFFAVGPFNFNLSVDTVCVQHREHPDISKRVNKHVPVRYGIRIQFDYGIQFFCS